MEYVDLYICHKWDELTPIEETLEALHQMVQSGKVRAIGISNCYAWQLAKANAIARANGWSEFVSVQNHYNLIFREEEREMAQLAHEENIAMTPYSSLASGRLSRKPDEKTKRLLEDTYAQGKYNKTQTNDQAIIQRVNEIAEKRQVSMTEISLAWLMTKTVAPIVGATKRAQIDGMVHAATITLTPEEIIYLEELYEPHELVGVMAK